MEFTAACAILLCCAWRVASTQDSDQQPPPGKIQVDDLREIRVVTLLEDPFVTRNQLDTQNYEGIFVDILNELCQRLNLTYTMKVQEDLIYGYERSPGNWTGTIGDLLNNKSDLVVAPLSIKASRHDVVDFTQPVLAAGLRILYQAPDAVFDGEAVTVLLTPFTVGLWVTVLVMFIAVSVLFYVIGRFSPYEDPAFVGKAATYEGLTLLNSFLYVFSSLTFQGYTAAPRSISGRILAAFWWMFTILVIAAYTASLAAIFLSMKPSVRYLPFDTFEELSLQREVAYGVVKRGTTMNYLKNSNQPLQRRLWTAMSVNENWMVDSLAEGIMRVQKSQGKYALIMEGPVAEALSGKQPCNLMVLGQPISEHAYAFACRKNTTLCGKLSTKILELQEEEFIYNVKHKWMHRDCNQRDEYIFQGLPFFDTFGGMPELFADRTVTLRRFTMGFIVIVIGMVSSALILFAEIFIAKRRGTSVPQRIPGGHTNDMTRIDREFRDEPDA